MNVAEALVARKSVRAFTDDMVSKEKITELLTLAGCAPSGVNTQPWRVAVITGEVKQRLQEKMVAAAEAGEKSSIAYQYYPVTWREPYKSRRKACGLLMYSTLQITREDTERQQQQWFANYRAFDAPVMLLFFIDKDLAEGSYIDYGMFLQSLMLAAVGQGLATCPQAALAEYPHIVKEVLGYDDSTTLLCGIALGYEDETALVNSYRTSREDVSTFTQFFD
jgi:nitroreductase